jgi:hypothetical protein
MLNKILNNVKKTSFFNKIVKINVFKSNILELYVLEDGSGYQEVITVKYII